MRSHGSEGMTVTSLSCLYVAQTEPHDTGSDRSFWPDGDGEQDAAAEDNLDDQIKKCIPTFSKLRDRALACPNKRTENIYIDTLTGHHFFRTCQRDSCLYCAPARCHWKGWAIHQSTPTHIVTITQVGDEWKAIKANMKAFHRAVRRRYPGYECAWTVERNPQGTGKHVHQWGRFHDTNVSLDGVAENIGMGFAEAEVLRVKTGPVTYPLKTIIDLHGAPVAEARATFQAYLDDNGGRLLNSTEKFWPEHDGKHHIKNAERQAKRTKRGAGTNRRYLMVPTDQLSQFHQRTGGRYAG
jgi:hypothetical protein